MNNDEDCVDTSTSRRGFVRRCLGTGAILAACPPSRPGAMGAEIARRPLVTASPELAEYERILSRTDQMDLLGRPRSWSVVQQGFHPFSPERIVVMSSRNKPSWSADRYRDRCGQQVKARLDERIDRLVEEHIEFNRRLTPSYTPTGEWFPESKRESIIGIMDAMSAHYRVRSQFEPWVVGLVERELLGSTALGDYGLAHQFQHGDAEIPVDCPPVDWWLFLFPEGLDWSSFDDQNIYAVVAHVARDRPYVSSGGMLHVWCLTQRIGSKVKWSEVSRMGRIEAARYLNPITANLLDDHRR
jgi:mannitol/fructose-specific phosphotransferase system IIA component